MFLWITVSEWVHVQSPKIMSSNVNALCTYMYTKVANMCYLVTRMASFDIDRYHPSFKEINLICQNRRIGTTMI